MKQAMKTVEWSLLALLSFIIIELVAVHGNAQNGPPPLSATGDLQPSPGTPLGGGPGSLGTKAYGIPSSYQNPSSMQSGASQAPSAIGSPQSAVPQQGPDSPIKMPEIGSFSQPEIATPQSRKSSSPQPTEAAPEILTFSTKPVAHENPLYAAISTSLGTFTVRLFPKYAPRNVRNFVELAKGEKEFTDARTSKRVRRPF